MYVIYISNDITQSTFIFWCSIHQALPINTQSTFIFECTIHQTLPFFMLQYSWIVLFTLGTLWGILSMPSLFPHSRKRTFKPYYDTKIKRKYSPISKLKLLPLCFFLFHLFRLDNLKEISCRDLLCLHSIKSRE